MKAVVQRVTQASCTVEHEVIGAINAGLVILVGIGPDDEAQHAQQLALKISKLRIFNDKDGKMNLSILDIGGAILSISQFTLFANTRSGNRPSYTGAAEPALAQTLYQTFNQRLQELGLEVAEGQFGAHMSIALVNDGPVTIQLDTDLMK